MITKWSELKYWKSGEYQVIRERLDDIRRSGRFICPRREDLFRALKLLPFSSVRVCILGQDPYPVGGFATGVAFSIPRDSSIIPATLANIFKEYQDDLHYPIPSHGDLSAWVNRGVLLWNVIPSCERGSSMSHFRWTEWYQLTEEILVELDNRDDIVFVSLGSVAKSFLDAWVYKCPKVSTSHPAPRGAYKGKHPFIGSRIFTTVNSLLVEQGLQPIDWNLECSEIAKEIAGSKDQQSSQGIDSAVCSALSIQINGS